MQTPPRAPVSFGSRINVCFSILQHLLTFLRRLIVSDVGKRTLHIFGNALHGFRLEKRESGDVFQRCITNGAIARENGEVYIYYASCDTRMHVATTTIDKLEDYLFNTPQDPHRSPDCVKQRCELISKTWSC